MQGFSWFSRVDPDRTAILIDHNRFSYGRLAADTGSLSDWLSAQEVIRGQRVGIFVPSLYWAWVARFAALCMGLTQVSLSSQSLREQAEVAGPLDLVLGELAGHENGTLARRVICWSPHSFDPLAEQPGFAVPRAGAVDPQGGGLGVCMLMTSGTTSRQRVVALDSKRLEARLGVLQSCQQVTEKTRLLASVGPNTMPGFGYTLATWQAGGTVLFATARERVSRLESNCFVTTPSELQKLLELDPSPWVNRATRRMIVVGGRLPSALRDKALNQICCQVVVDYGATETNCTATGDACLLERHPGAIGFALPGADFEVVDSQGQKLPPGKEGLVRTRTTNMVHGYGANQEVEANVFRDGWFYPGDLGVQFEDGMLAITGRVAETLNLGGTKIPLLDFEAPLQRLPEVEDGCAIVLKVDDLDSLALLVVCSDQTDLGALMQSIASLLPFRVPFKLVRVASIPRNSMGKIPRNALSQLYSEAYRREVGG